MNSQKLKGKLVEKRKNYAQGADAIGVSRPTFYKKVNGKTKFYIDEVELLSNFLELTDSEKAEIFFD